MPRSLGSFRERLPPWPLGARDKVDMDFRTACIKENGIQSLMRAQPQLAAEVLLSPIIEAEPDRKNGHDRFAIDLAPKTPTTRNHTAFRITPTSPSSTCT